MTKVFFRIFGETLAVLSPSQKRKGAVMFFLSVINVFLDLISLVSLLPLLFAYLEPGAIENSAWLQPVFAFFSFESHSEFLRASVFFIFFLFLFKTCFSYLVIKWKARFVHGVSREVLLQLYQNLVYERNLVYEKEAIGDVVKNVIHIPELFAAKVLRSFLDLFVNLIVALAILCALIAYEPEIFFYLSAVLFPAILLYFIYQNKRLSHIKTDIEHQYPAMIQWVVQSAEGKLEILLTKSFSFFKEKVWSSSKRYFDAIIRQNTVLNSSAKWIEFIAVIGVCALFYIFTYRPEEQEALFALLSIYTISAYRLIPALNLIGTSYTNIKIHEFTIEHLLKQLVNNISLDTRQDSKPISFERKIEVKALNFQYEETDFHLRDLNLEVARGEKVAIVGESGSGKTTLIKLLLGVLRNDKGSISIDSHPLTESNRLAWQEKIAYVPQDPFVFNATLFENIAMGASYSDHNVQRVSEFLELLELSGMVREHGDGLRMNVGENGSRLSGGQKQRISIARALFQDKPVMIFDEATSNLDAFNRKKVYEIVRDKLARDKTILFITHQTDLLDGYDQIIEMSRSNT